MSPLPPPARGPRFPAELPGPGGGGPEGGKAQVRPQHRLPSPIPPRPAPGSVQMAPLGGSARAAGPRPGPAPLQGPAAEAEIRKIGVSERLPAAQSPVFTCALDPPPHGHWPGVQRLADRRQTAGRAGSKDSSAPRLELPRLDRGRDSNSLWKSPKKHPSILAPLLQWVGTEVRACQLGVAALSSSSRTLEPVGARPSLRLSPPQILTPSLLCLARGCRDAWVLGLVRRGRVGSSLRHGARRRLLCSEEEEEAGAKEVGTRNEGVGGYLRLRRRHPLGASLPCAGAQRGGEATSGFLPSVAASCAAEDGAGHLGGRFSGEAQRSGSRHLVDGEAPCPKPPPPEGAKSNPSKRHRDRLNQELNRLTNLLPFPEDVRARLDKLSILRLAVGYLKVKSYFTGKIPGEYGNIADQPKEHSANSGGNDKMPPHIDRDVFSEGDLLLQALHGFLIAVTADGYIFYVSSTVQDHLGFHQSDIIYQSIFELIHTDDRAVFHHQLHWSLKPTSFREVEQDSRSLPENESPLNSGTTTYDPQHLPPENSSFLERSFVCRLRCLLDNSSGFMALNFHGRLKFLHGQNKRAEDGSLMPPQLALFAIAMPLQPLSIQKLQTKIYFFQTKHKLDFTPMACDARGKALLGYTESELYRTGSGYQLIHAGDMMYCAEKHVKIMKIGESGMVIFRLLTKKAGWLWIQSNARLVYKGGRPDCIIARQRVLSNEEGEEHLHKRASSTFNFTTGEAILYENNLPGFLNSLHPRKEFRAKKEVNPNLHLGAMMHHDESVYVSQAISVPSFSFTDVMQASREWDSSDKKEKLIKDDSDSLLTIIETLFEKNETGNDIYKSTPNLDAEDLKFRRREESMFLMNQLGSSSFQGRLEQGTSSIRDEVIIPPENGKYMDFSTLNITMSLQSLSLCCRALLVWFDLGTESPASGGEALADAPKPSSL
ncbi:aryl hydrocarbon receptor-like [Gracilinanus agilis]|uniref:aryl hydrocarbon receptor-like n=1 Tax=Gracilinanus agilis TaxID=191870 RepID=UPI001CFF224A|nr:aryl hydrocarbon receptor-like [Gracilinanus agilis]